jgi:PAS domain S-box-containing protein
MIGSIIAWGNISASGRYEEHLKISSKIFQGTIGVIRDITERKTAEAKLRDQEKRFHSLVDSINDGFIQVDHQDRVLYVNDNLCRMTGYARDEIIGKIGYRLLFDPPEQAVIKTKNALRRRKIADRYEIKMRKKNGEYIWVQISGSPLLDDRGRAMGSIGIFSDISERKRAEMQLHFQADMLSHVSDAIITTNQDFRIQTWNQAAEKMFGINAHEVIGKPFDKLILTRNLGKTEKISLNKIMKTGQWFGEITFTRKDGKDLQIQISLTLIRDPKAGYSSIVAIIRDITERKRAEEALKRKEEEYRTLAENSPDMIARFDKQLRHTYVNAAAARGGRLSASEYIGKTISESGVPEPAAGVWEQRIRRVLETGQAIEVVDTFPTPDGIRYFNTRFIPELAPDGSIQSVLSVARDFTERKRAEEALKTSEERFRLAAENLTDVVYEWNLKEKIDWYGDIDRIMGYPPGGFPRTFDGWVAAIYPEDKDRVMKAIEDQLKEARPYIVEYRVMKKSGQLRWWSARGTPLRDKQGKPYKWIGSITDITISKQADMSLKTSEERYRILVETANDAIIVAQDGIMKFANPRARAILKYHQKTLLTRPFTYFIHPEDRVMVADRYRRRIAGQVVPDTYVFRIVDRDSKLRWVEIRSALIKWEGRPATLNFLSDITERKKYEHTLARYLEAERILAKTSEMIVKTSDINLAITRILALLGKTLNTDWLGIFQLDEDRVTLDNTYEWRKPGMKSLKAAFQGITEESHPWSFGKLKSGKILNIPTADLPSASKSRKLYRKHGIKAILIIPIFYEDRLYGSIDVFSKTTERICDDEDIRLLKTTGDIIATGAVKHQVQIRLNRALDELKSERKRMIELTKRTIDAQEKERFYLSSEIHDNLLQEMAGMLYYVKNIEAPVGVRDIEEKRNKLIENIKSLISRGRALISYIEPLQDPAINLIQGIKKSFDVRFADSNVRLDLHHPSKMPDIIFFLKVNILRIVQEAFMNIYKHARATAVSVTISLDKDQIIIKTKDNGVGFSPAKIDRGKKGHYGLLSMQERVKLIGGTLSIISKPGSGTIVTAEIPLK